MPNVRISYEDVLCLAGLVALIGGLVSGMPVLAAAGGLVAAVIVARVIARMLRRQGPGGDGSKDG